MFRRTSQSAFAFLSLALGLALPNAVQSQVVVDPLPSLSVSPNPAPAEKAFTLTLLGVSSGCTTTFSRETVTVVGNRINLSYVANTFIVDPPIFLEGDAAKPYEPICPVYDLPQTASDAPILPYYSAPTYKMPPLKAGTYEVWATQMYECLYTRPSCEIAVRPVSAGKLTVQPDGAISYLISPTTAPAGKDFELSLLSYQFNCGTTFDNLSVSVSGNEIVLSFLDHEKAGVACPAIYRPYGPTFKMAALKPGAYKVRAYRHPACLPCKMMGVMADVGTLTITGDTPDRKGWFLKKRETLAGKPFTLQLLNNAYGNCQTSFSHKSIVAEGNSINASFLVETNPDIVCITDIRPHGPSFEMAALKVGVYPVYVQQLLQCQVTAPFCAIKMPMPVPSDTLVVTQTLSVLLSELRAGAPKADLQGSRAAVVLPEGIGGTWKAELLSLNGQRLSATSLNAEGGNRAEFELGVSPQRGVYLLRLSAPDGATHMIPIIRKD